eukprot:TRINITY_DN65488_c0_g1_i1.p1 TRINITY_DN65488_c0_g1~~TRINITY_DN65488_c0_g1_i1.p1  ORF type:complete len:602 (+),score=50.48 TRINITY_DN65488_c0_g1_i1:172-1977(+)
MRWLQSTRLMLMGVAVLLSLHLGARYAWCGGIDFAASRPPARLCGHPWHAQPQSRQVVAHALGSIPPGELTQRIRDARQTTELFELYDAFRMDLVHRATILYKLAVLVGQDKDSTWEAAQQVAQTPSFSALLAEVTTDLRRWKNSARVKANSKDPVSEQAQYLGNIVWALGELVERLRGAQAIGHSTEFDRLQFLFELAVCSVCELQPSLTTKQHLQEVIQVLWGLCRSPRSAQVDMLFESWAPVLSDMLGSDDDVRLLQTSMVVFAYGHYGIQSRHSVQLLSALRLVIEEVLHKGVAADDVSLLSNIASGYALAFRSAQVEAKGSGRFAALFDRTSSSPKSREPGKLGLLLQGRESLRVMKVNDGLVRKYNRRYRNLQILPGDEVMRVNAVGGDAARMQRELQSSTDWVLLSVDPRNRDAEVLQEGKCACSPTDLAACRALIEQVGVLFLDLVERDEAAGRRTDLKKSANFFISLGILGISSGAVFQRFGRRIVDMAYTIRDFHVSQILWIQSQVESRDKAVITAMANRVATMYNKPGVIYYREAFGVSYHALNGLGYSRNSKPMQSLLAASQRVGITEAELQSTNPVPSVWRARSAAET